MKNSNSSSAIKLVLSIFFLFALMYLVYFILNKKSAKINTNVAYGESYKDTSTDLPNKLQNIKMDVTSIKPIEKEKEPVVDDTLTKVKTDIIEDTFFGRLLKDITNASSLIGGKGNVDKFKTKIEEVNHICNELSVIFKFPISIQSVVQGIELKKQSYNGPYKDKIDQLLAFLNEMILIKIDTNVSNFCNRVVNIITGSSGQDVKEIIEKEKLNDVIPMNGGNNETEEIKLPDKNEKMNQAIKESSFMKEIQNAYDEEILVIKNKIADMIRRHFQPEIQMAISITQIYNSGFAIVFANAQPEIGLFCFMVTQLYPNETKGSVINTIGSVASIGYNSVKSKFGNMFGSKKSSTDEDLVDLSGNKTSSS